MYLLQSSTTDQIKEVLKFNSNDITLIGFLLLVSIVLAIAVYKLYKDNKEYSKMVLEALNKSAESYNKLNTTLEIIKSNKK